MGQVLVGLTEIARILGVSRQRASEIVSVHADFPPPAAILGGRRGWERRAVEDWLARHPNRTPGRPPKRS